MTPLYKLIEEKNLNEIAWRRIYSNSPFIIHDSKPSQVFYFMAYNQIMKAIVAILFAFIMFSAVATDISNFTNLNKLNEAGRELQTGHFIVQWEKSYGKLWWWSARYEGPQPVGDADNDGLNELLIGGRDPFLRVMKWNGETYVEKKLIDPVFGIGYGIWIRIGKEWYRFPQPFGSATGFAIGDADNDGLNEICVAWGRHLTAYKWNGKKYEIMGRYIVIGKDEGGTTLDCIIGDADNDGLNEVVVTGGYERTSSLIVLKWNGNEFVKEAEWGSRSIYFPWIADADNDGKNEVIVGHGRELTVLKWSGNEFTSYAIDKFPDQVFGCVTKDSNGDGINEIHVTFWAPRLCIYRFNGSKYEKIFDKTWNGEEATIEAIDVGDVDNDGLPEVAVGTNYIHILQWNGSGYEEEYVINETYGLLAVTCIGDMDNDGKNEINAGAVGVRGNEDYKAWIFKYVE